MVSGVCITKSMLTGPVVLPLVSLVYLFCILYLIREVCVSVMAGQHRLHFPSRLVFDIDLPMPGET
jgi:hypothetical protein